MKTDWPQITYLILAGLNLLLAAGMDGKPKVGEHKFGTTLISSALSAWILWAGGFFG